MSGSANGWREIAQANDGERRMHGAALASVLVVLALLSSAGCQSSSVTQRVQARAALLGDGVRDLAEGCDDGNVLAGDGCSAAGTVEPGFQCERLNFAPLLNGQFEAPALQVLAVSGNALPGWQIDVGTLDHLYNAPIFGGFGCAQGNGCVDLAGDARGSVFQDVTTVPGRTYALTFRLGAASTAGRVAAVQISSPGLLPYRTGLFANPDLSAVAAANPAPAASNEQMRFRAESARTRIRFAALDADVQGATLDVVAIAEDVCRPLACGNNVVDAGEACDDGNALPGDGCSGWCRAEVGYACPSVFGIPTPGACSAACGNGQRVSAEACDDGNLAAGDGCSAACAVEPSFNCTVAAPLAAASTCTRATCGDGAVAAPLESCDDGNALPGDGCSAACTWEPGFDCRNQPSVCSAVCGDSVRASIEGCDDGNVLPGDGCNAQCKVEIGYPVLGNVCNAAAAAACAVGVCSASDNRCGALNGEPAMLAAQCRSGVLGADGACGYANGEGTCSNADAATRCRARVCDVDLKCGLRDGSAGCTAASAALVCRSASCGAVSSKCTPLGLGCAEDADCDLATRYCNISLLQCTPKLANGAVVPTDLAHVSPPLAGLCSAAVGALVCSSGVCDTRDNRCGYDVQGASVCTAANSAKVCRSGFCSASLSCAAPGACLVEADCPAGFCNISARTCLAKLPAGAPLPSDPGHGNAPLLNGLCNAAAAALVCAAGACDVGDNKCGLANGVACTQASAGSCRAAVCSGADSLCGLPAGADCMSSDECRSAVCDASKRCEGDADGDGVPDSVERVLGSDSARADSDGDGIADAAELSASHNGNAPFSKVDTDADGRIDALDDDDDNDGLSSAAERGAGAVLRDSDADGIPDYRDSDDDADGVSTAAELGPGAVVLDSDRDKISDYLDADDDGDGVATLIELGAEGIAAPRDTDGDGRRDYLDSDDDGDSVATRDEWGAPGRNSAADSDRDGIVDYLDSDDDNDSISTRQEVLDGLAPAVGSDDVDRDGLRNYVDEDSDADGIADRDEREDVNGDKIPDYLQSYKTSKPALELAQPAGCSCTSGPTRSSPGSAWIAAFGFAFALVARSRKRCATNVIR